MVALLEATEKLKTSNNNSNSPLTISNENKVKLLFSYFFVVRSHRLFDEL